MPFLGISTLEQQPEGQSPEIPENVQATRLVIALCPSVSSGGPVPFCVTFTVQRELNLPDIILPDMQETAVQGFDSKSIKSCNCDRKLMYITQVESTTSKTNASLTVTPKHLQEPESVTKSIRGITKAAHDMLELGTF